MNESRWKETDVKIMGQIKRLSEDTDKGWEEEEKHTERKRRMKRKKDMNTRKKLYT
jgi:hypothetical protein